MLQGVLNIVQVVLSFLPQIIGEKIQFLTTAHMFHGCLARRNTKKHLDCKEHEKLGGGFTYFLFSSLLGEDFHFDKHIFQMGRNHQLGNTQTIF